MKFMKQEEYKMIKTFEVKSIEEFIELACMNSDCYFRGQENGEDWQLIPKIGRTDTLERFDEIAKNYGLHDWTSLEDYLVEKFERFGVKYGNFEYRDKIDWLVLGQHYGLPTRLLDWTNSPLVALFFALNNINTINKESVVWIITKFNRKTWRMDIDFDDISNIEFYLPRPFNRINSQDSCFTICPLPNSFNKIKSLEEIIEEQNIGENIKLDRILIPNNKDIKREMFRSLNRLGINYDYVFSDLTGLSKQIVYELKECVFRY